MNQNDDKPDDKAMQVVGMIALALGLTMVLVGGVDAARLAMERSQPMMGDIIVVPPGGAVHAVRYQVEARLPDGRECIIGTGSLADKGGVAEVVGLGEPDKNGEIMSTVAWSGPGRSASQGTDCGQAVDVRLSRRAVYMLRAAANGVDPYNPTPTVDGVGGM